MSEISSLEFRKRELGLSLDSFAKPLEMSDATAWSQLMLNLIFLQPGTYPSIPEMGVGIENYQYDFVDEVISELSASIITQQQTYLPDIPLSGLKISQMELKGQPVLVIQMYFTTKEGSYTNAIALNTRNRKFLDFEVSW